VNLFGDYGAQRVTKTDTGLHDARYLPKRIVELMMGVLGRYMGRGWFYCPLVSGVKWGE